MAENRFGRTSTLKVVTDEKNGSTFLADCYYTPPLKIMQPVYHENQEMELIQMSASAGMMAGDHQEIAVTVGENSRLILTYCLLPAIPFGASAFSNEVKVELADESAGFILGDTISCGRYGMGERFAYRYYKSRIEVRKKGKLVYRDHTFFEPAEQPLDKIGFFEGFRHVCNLCFFNCGIEEELELKIWDYLKSCEELGEKAEDENENITAGMTRLESGDLLIKLFAMTGQKIELIQAHLLKIVKREG